MGQHYHLSSLLLSALVLAPSYAASSQQDPPGSLIQNQGPLGLYLSEDLSLDSSRFIPQNITTHTNSRRRATNARSVPSETSHTHIRRRRLDDEELSLFLSGEVNLAREEDVSTTISPSPPLKAFYYFLQALGRSDNSGCAYPQPSFVATCPEGAFIVSQSARTEWKSRLDCVSLSETQIRCTPKAIDPNDEVDQQVDLNDQNGVTMACYGTALVDTDGNSIAEDDYLYDNLQVSVQVEAGSYTCEKAIESRTDPIPTVVSGGNVYQTVAIQKQCLSNAQQNEAWVFVEPTCDVASMSGIAREDNTGNITAADLLQVTTVPIQYGSRNNNDNRIVASGSDNVYDQVVDQVIEAPSVTIAHCEIENACQAEYSCDDSFTECFGITSCQVEIPTFVTNSTAEITTAALLQDNECSPRDFFMDLDSGEFCEFNTMCSSGICIGGICLDMRLPDHEICEEGEDCASGACGKHPLESVTVESIENDSIPIKTCCPSGETFGHEGESFCTSSQPIGAACHEDAMCQSDICVFNTCLETLLEVGVECEEPSDCFNGVCANYHDTSGTQVCCPTGESIILTDGVKCSNRTAGDVCENNINSLCQSNICVEGVCLANEQEAGALCDNHSDCVNDACGLESVDPLAPSICCETGEFVFVPQDNVTTRTIDDNEENDDSVFGSNSLRVCTGQPVGASCGGADAAFNELCESGFCIGGYCAATRLAPGMVCEEDMDCENNVCALSSLEDEASTVCCESGDHRLVYVENSIRSKNVCTGQPVGAQCGRHNINVLCESGICSSGVCIDMP